MGNHLPYLGSRPSGGYSRHLAVAPTSQLAVEPGSLRTSPDLRRVPPRADSDGSDARVRRVSMGALQNAEAGIVYVVDDDDSIRRSVRNFLSSEGLAVATFPDAQVFLAASVAHPSCLVLDLELPGLNGLELQRQLLERDAPPVIFLSGQGDIPRSVSAMKAGAVTFLTKPFRPEELLTAVEEGLRRDRAAQAERMDIKGLRERYQSLTPREQHVLRGVVAGLLNKQIAADFGTKEATIKEQRGNVMRKMKASSLADLVRMAERLGVSCAKE
jgi:FixJ family two-component response regulator